MKKKLYDRCMGACCEDIGLKVSPEELKLSYWLWLKDKEKTGGHSVIKSVEEISLTLDKVKIYEDIYLIYPGWEFMGDDHCHPEVPDEKNEEIIYHYKCRFFDKKKRECSIYEIRPIVCRTYPDGPDKHGFKFCRNPKCQWKKQIELRKQYNAKIKEIKKAEKDKSLSLNKMRKKRGFKKMKKVVNL